MGGPAPPPSPKMTHFWVRPPHRPPHISKGWAGAPAPHKKIPERPPHQNFEAPPQAPPPIYSKFFVLTILSVDNNYQIFPFLFQF